MVNNNFWKLLRIPRTNSVKKNMENFEIGKMGWWSVFFIIVLSIVWQKLFNSPGGIFICFAFYSLLNKIFLNSSRVEDNLQQVNL